ncbi:PAS domain S-box protein [Pantanalinema sp. GBBB05]|uniref:PAS domain S-box protein n=1 Tax=Pantanalinema sp. GBBB05 TaxID=2604139 RepID=UPI001D87BA22|nr:PAS domain S-box protein [Pantanalinema sp. GBBB05]
MLSDFSALATDLVLAIALRPLLITPDQSLRQAIEIMHQAQIQSCNDGSGSGGNAALCHSCVLVMEETRLVGILTTIDVVRLIAVGAVAETITVGAVMTPNVVTIKQAHVSIAGVFDLFRRHQLHHLPLIDSSDRVVGIITPERVLQGLKWTDLLNLVEQDLLLEQKANDLEKRETRLRRLVASVPGMLYQYMLHIDGSESFPFIGYNCRTIFEIEQDLALQDPQFLWRMTHPEDLPELRESLQLSAQTLQSWKMEWRILTPSGGCKWVQGVARPGRQENGDIVWNGMILDITDRKKLEEERDRFFKELRRSHDELEHRVQERTAALQEAYQELNSLIENSPLAVVEWDSDFQVRGWSSQAEKLFGWQAREVFGKHPDDWQFVYAADRQTVQTAITLLLNGSEAQSVYGSRNLTKSGAVVYCEWYNSALVDESGNLISVLSLVLDVTQRKQAEAELQASQRRFATAFHSSPVPLCLTTFPESCHLDVNDSWVLSTGYSREQAIGRTVNELELWQFVEEREQFMQAMREQGSIRNFLMHSKTQKGEIRKVLLSCDKIELDGTLCLLSAVIDITEQKRIEEALRDSEALYRTLIHNFPNGAVHLFDRHLRYVFTDGQELAAMGMSREQFEGRTLWEALPPELVPIMEPLYRQALEGQSVTQELPFGNRVYIIYVVPVRNDQNDVFAGLVLIQNITTRKHMEAALMQARDELESRVQERTEELAAVNFYLQDQILEHGRLAERLAISNQELEQFAYIASHDLQEPLRTITSYTQLLAKRYAGQLDAKADKYIGYIVDGSSRMQQLITDLLAYSRVGRQELKLELTDCNELLQKVLHNLQVAIAESAAIVTCDRLPTVLVDAGRIMQLLQNLIGNAIKYCDKTPPEVHVGVLGNCGEDGDVEADREKAEIANVALEHEYVFWIRDNGIGIEPQYIERIFVIFQRLHTRREYAGTGIGLAVCKKIVERHKGRIWVESEPGQGATFYFTLPKGEMPHSEVEE